MFRVGDKVKMLIDYSYPLKGASKLLRGNTYAISRITSDARNTYLQVNNIDWWFESTIAELAHKLPKNFTGQRTKTNV